MKVEIVGHRGASGEAPENTLPAFLKAAAYGLSCVELDVRLSRDQQVVCFHDPRLERVTPESGAIADWDWTDLSRVAVLPGAFDDRYPDARIPLLSDVLSRLPGDVRLLVELKADPVRPAELVERTLAVIASAGAGSRCRLISFDADLLGRARSQSPEIPLGYIAAAKDKAQLLSTGKLLGVAAVHLQHNAINGEFATAAKDAGFLVNAWTVNTGEEVRRLVGLGVQELTTDFPQIALNAAAQ